ncbi:DUF3168 domain-containing protein [Endozoicomonas gorgoniicola]|uniref:DUF3168 domain-containing protein n=1 Tax=Endozoicomonas gorgoniicola TaxID=1234144 RepID=A0ABT3MSQ6_9GAMM|nr:DUF3168 domain-containing protein [Endozoicomonas gorgoniicola]MCW7552133.1 DUF3168 domain-containing protein [Endozoicomonas gorgoniicola]
MILEQGLFDHLKKHLNASIYGQLRGERLPAVVYTLISSPVETSLSIVDNVCASRYQIDCYSRKYIQVKQLATSVINALHQHRGSLGDYPIQLCLLENRQDGFEDQPCLHRQILSFVIYH